MRIFLFCDADDGDEFPLIELLQTLLLEKERGEAEEAAAVEEEEEPTPPPSKIMKLEEKEK